MRIEAATADQSPPGGGTLARPSRASSGPARRNDARIRAASAVSTSYDESPCESIANLVGACPFRGRARAADELEHRLDIADARDVRQRDRLVGEQARRENRSAPFLFPEARMWPLRAFPPSMTRACGAVFTDIGD